MAVHGFHVCHDDLQDELIRALGAAETVGLLRTLGVGEQFATFCRQPAWRGRPVHEQLHRFVGTTSGRKEALAAALAGALSPERVPTPWRLLLDQVETRLSPDQIGRNCPSVGNSATDTLRPCPLVPVFPDTLRRPRARS